MNCPYCGKEINPTDIFCEHCDAYVGNTGANTPPKTVPKATTPAPKVAKNPPKKTTIGPSIYTTSTSQQAPAKFSYTDYIIKSNSAYFNFYLWLPLILSLLLALGSLISGIILMANEEVVIGFCACWLGGGTTSVLCYFYMKILFSYQVLHIYYLKGLYENKK